MLVVISDLHLTDGSNGVGLDPGALELFAPRMAELALRASWRRDGRYRPLERIDLLLLGDVLDFTRSRRWLETLSRPWSALNAPGLLETAGSILDDILTTNETSLRMLRGLATDGALRLPPATTAGMPATHTEPMPIPVAIHYMVGNSDWLLHARGAGWELQRRRVCHALGLINESRRPFPHDAAESEELLAVLRAHSVVARHGDLFDPLHCGEDRENSSIGEALAIDLIQRFQVEVELRYAEELPAGTLRGIRELEHFRPVALAAVFLESVLERSGLRPQTIKEFKRLWDELAEALLDQPHMAKRGGLSPLDLIDPLAQSILFSRKGSRGWATRTRNWLCSLRGVTVDSYFPHALAETDCRNRRAQQIVYGHTHAVETVPLDASHADGFILPQTYFNTGTWRRVYQPTQSVAAEHEFIAHDNFTFLAFFQGDERGGRPYETWTGALGANESFAGMTPKVAAATASIQSPHFQFAGSLSPKGLRM